MSNDDYHSRQSFLGPRLPEALEHARITVIGVSGGGSHVVQQLAHIGFQKLTLLDPQPIELPNLHRHVGARRQDVIDGLDKVAIGQRVVLDLWPDAHVNSIAKRWQDCPDFVRRSDLIFGCVDGFRERLDLEASARRYAIPYIDIGLRVADPNTPEQRMSGQIVLSMPGTSCFRCMRAITDRDLSEEAEHSGGYPGLGPNPQVVWANGTLASHAVGLGLDLLTAWSPAIVPAPYLVYEGNECRVRERNLGALGPCVHYAVDGVGDPRL